MAILGSILNSNKAIKNSIAINGAFLKEKIVWIQDIDMKKKRKEIKKRMSEKD